MEVDGHIDEGIAFPTGKLRVRIEQLAAILVKQEMEKGAEAAAKTREAILVKRIAEHPYLDRDHPFFPFFETRLRLFKSNPALMPEFKKKEEAAAAEASAAASNANPNALLTEQEQLQERERKIREEQLAAAELQAKRDRTDPHPNMYSLHLPTGVSISRPVYDVMVLTAQCAAKGGRPFMEQVLRIHRSGNRLFSFANDEDPAYPTFAGLVESYERILNYRAAEVQDRLEIYERGGAPLQEVFTAKANFMAAEAARTKAAVLTDDQLRKRLQWSSFVVKKNFSAAELGLQSAAQKAAEAPPVVAPTAAVPNGAIGWGDVDDNANVASSSGAPSAGTHREVMGIAKRSGNSEYVKDPVTGELVHMSQVTLKGNGTGNGGGGSLFGTDTTPASGVMQQAGQKRERDDGLASYAAFEANLRK